MKTLLETEDLKPILERLEKIEKVMSEKQRGIENKFVDNEEFLKLMNVSKRTAQTWRDNLIVPFSQIGGKIYYRMQDVNKLLEKHYHGN